MSAPFLVPVPDEIPFGPPPDPDREWYEDRGLWPVCFVVGVDLGQARDFTAIGIDEVNFATRVHYRQPLFAPRPSVREEKIRYHRIRHVERVPLGTSYPDVLARVAALLTRLPAMPRDPVLVMDATGCGRPVMDLARKSGLNPIGVTITAGGGETIVGSDARVAKKLLASGVAVALDTGRLQMVAAGEHVETLRNELRAFRVKITPGQNESFESWREADHDDLVLATALAVWAADRVPGQRMRVNPNWRL